mgnify:CR=1 FL=1
MSASLVGKLNELAKLRSQLEIIHIERQAAIEQVIPEEIKTMLNKLEFDFGEKFNLLTKAINELEQEIRLGTIGEGRTVKGMYLQAVFSKGITSWDTKGLEEYAKTHPEVISFRKQGVAFVAIRKIAKQSVSLSISTTYVSANKDHIKEARTKENIAA